LTPEQLTAQQSRSRIGQVERVVLNALPKTRAFAPDICAFGDPIAIVLRTRRSTLEFATAQQSRSRIGRVERVVLNALPKTREFAPDICTFGDSTAIVLRTRRST
jgi:hypothetical protein